MNDFYKYKMPTKKLYLDLFISTFAAVFPLSYRPNSNWSFYASKEAARARLSLHMSKYHIVGNHMSRLINVIDEVIEYWPS